MTIEKGNIIGIIGGGQLAKMLVDAAREMGFRTAVLDPSPEACGGKIADIHIKGEYDDGKSLQLMAEIADVITYEFENIPATSLEVLKYFKAYIPQGARPLHISQHRIREKDAVSKLGIKTAKYLPVKTVQDLSMALESIGYPAILKTACGGYDGKNQWILKNPEDLKYIKLKKQEYILEEMINFQREVSCIVVRNLDDEIITFPIGENFHEKGILKTTKVPADISSNLCHKIEATGKKIMEGLDFIGILGIEFFLSECGEIYFNEMAPRPHNSGHYSLDACDYSQFHLHIMSICGMPLKTPQLKKNCIMLNILGENRKKVEKFFEDPDIKVHIYGKEGWKTGRKMGHINFVGNNLEELVKKVENF